MTVAVDAVAAGVHHPAEHDGQQHESDEPADQGPVHGHKHIRASGMERDLLAGRRKRPGHLALTLLTKNEAQLAGRTQSVGMRRAEGRAGFPRLDRAQLILMKEAVLAAGFRRCSTTVRHVVTYTPFES